MHFKFEYTIPFAETDDVDVRAVQVAAAPRSFWTYPEKVDA